MMHDKIICIRSWMKWVCTNWKIEIRVLNISWGFCVMAGIWPCWDELLIFRSAMYVKWSLEDWRKWNWECIFSYRLWDSWVQCGFWAITWIVLLQLVWGQLEMKLGSNLPIFHEEIMHKNCLQIDQITAWIRMTIT